VAGNDLDDLPFWGECLFAIRELQKKRGERGAPLFFH
jgi:hypothetical protein